MARKRVVVDKIRVLSEEDVMAIEYDRINDYDFFDTPDEYRPLILGNFLAWGYKEADNLHFAKTKKSLSQNRYARFTLGLDPVIFSNYKNGTRNPSHENADILAKALGNIIYDIIGMSRKMPQDRQAYEMLDIFNELTDRERKEIIERSKNMVVNHEPDNDGDDGNEEHGGSFYNALA